MIDHDTFTFYLAITYFIVFLITITTELIATLKERSFDRLKIDLKNYSNEKLFEEIKKYEQRN